MSGGRDIPEVPEPDDDGACVEVKSRAQLVERLAGELDSAPNGAYPVVDLTDQTVGMVFDPFVVGDEANEPLVGHEVVEIDPVSSHEAFKVMERFAAGRTGKEAERLWRALEVRHPFRAFRNAVESLGILQEWYDWRERAFLKFAEERLEAAEVDFVDGRIVCRNPKNTSIFEPEDPYEDWEEEEDGEEEGDGEDGTP